MRKFVAKFTDMNRFALFILLALAALGVSAQEAVIDTVAVLPPVRVSIVERLQGNPNVALSQPEALTRRVEWLRQADGANADAQQSARATVTAGGYRIQVFSDSNARTARHEANAKAASISERFPHWATYITFDSPYWRLRVGDFRTYDDATEALGELKAAFPSYRREMRVVRDHIKVAAD